MIIRITGTIRNTRIIGIIRIIGITRIIRITGIIMIIMITRITGITRIIRINRITGITRRQRQCPYGLPREVSSRRRDRPAGQWTGRIQQRSNPQRRLFYRYQELDTGSWRDGSATTQWISWWILDRQLRHFHADSTRHY